MPFSTLRGFRDYPPPEAGARSELVRRMRSVARRAGFTELETPSVESVDLFRVKSGEEITQQLWTFTDKGGRPVALVAETTPSLARVFVDRAKSEPLPVKWFTVSKLWRYEEPQAGRTREFQQFNLDILGAPGVEAEVELLATAAAILDDGGARGLYGFRLNDRRLAESRGRALGLSDLGRYFHLLDRYRKLSPSEVDRGLAELSLSTQADGRLRAQLEEGSKGVRASEASTLWTRLEGEDLPGAGPTAVRDLRKLFALADKMGIADRLIYDPTVVRGIAYYTSTVFEAYDLSGDLRSLFGGGRYDHLTELFGGPATPACGLAIGDQTLELLLKVNDRWPAGEPGLDTYVVAVSAEDVPDAAAWVQRLRAAGVSADWDLLGRSLSRQLKEAARRKARRALILGPEERSRGTVVERDLASGTQHEIRPDEVLPPA
ncbi:MAG: histidine--tRNA ligase [Thermoplasmata archaeon]